MANQNKKDDLNQNQHNQKAMAAGASAQSSISQPEPETIEGVDSPESIGGERPNRSNTGSMKHDSGERLDLKGSEEPSERNKR